jgi:hypothetical protein
MEGKFFRVKMDTQKKDEPKRHMYPIDNESLGPSLLTILPDRKAVVAKVEYSATLAVKYI